MTIEEYKTAFTTAIEGIAIDCQANIQREEYRNMMLALEQLRFSDIIQAREDDSPGQTIRNVFLLGVAAGKFLEYRRPARTTP